MLTAIVPGFRPLLDFLVGIFGGTQIIGIEDGAGVYVNVFAFLIFVDAWLPLREGLLLSLASSIIWSGVRLFRLFRALWEMSPGQ